jgi:hypothetical protein
MIIAYLIKKNRGNARVAPTRDYTSSTSSQFILCDWIRLALSCVFFTFNVLTHRLHTLNTAVIVVIRLIVVVRVVVAAVGIEVHVVRVVAVVLLTTPIVVGIGEDRRKHRRDSRIATINFRRSQPSYLPSQNVSTSRYSCLQSSLQQ